MVTIIYTLLLKSFYLFFVLHNRSVLLDVRKINIIVLPHKAVHFTAPMTRAFELALLLTVKRRVLHFAIVWLSHDVANEKPIPTWSEKILL